MVTPSVQHFALQQQLASLTASVADHEDAILELERQVATLETGVQRLDTKARELGELLSESLSVVEDRVKVMDEDLKDLLELRTAEIISELKGQMAQGMVRVSALDDAVINESRDTGLKFQEVVRKLNVFTERITNLEQWGDKLSEHLNACLDRVTNLEQWGDELAASLCERYAASPGRDINTGPRSLGLCVVVQSGPCTRWLFLSCAGAWTVYEMACFL